VDPISGVGYFSHPDYATKPPNLWPGWDLNASRHLAYNYDGTYNIDIPNHSENVWTDYGIHSQPYGYWGHKDDWGNFWQKKSRSADNKELRWLVLIGCFELCDESPYYPIRNWKKAIEEGYLSSVCNFDFTINDITWPFINRDVYNFMENGKLALRYFDNLKYIATKEEVKNSGTFLEPVVKCYRANSYWYSESDKPTDISVAAYMEAACSLVGNVRAKTYEDYDLHHAKAIDRDNYDGEYYYWVLSGSTPEKWFENYNVGIHSFDLKILKYDLGGN